LTPIFDPLLPSALRSKHAPPCVPPPGRLEPELRIYHWNPVSAADSSERSPTSPRCPYLPNPASPSA